MIWSAQTIKDRTSAAGWRELIIQPFIESKYIENGMSFGLTAAGYDIRLGQPSDSEFGVTGIRVPPGGFELAHSLEYVKIPQDCLAIVHDKSSFARRGLSLFNTVLEPGWFGFITLELANHSLQSIYIPYGSPIAQIVFHQLDQKTSLPYNGKYQGQPNRPIPALAEGQKL